MLLRSSCSMSQIYCCTSTLIVLGKCGNNYSTIKIKLKLITLNAQTQSDIWTFKLDWEGFCFKLIILVWVILKEHFSLPHPLITSPGGHHTQSEMDNCATLGQRWHKSELCTCCGVYISFITHKAVGHNIFEVAATYHVTAGSLTPQTTCW